MSEPDDSKKRIGCLVAVAVWFFLFGGLLLGVKSCVNRPREPKPVPVEEPEPVVDPEPVETVIKAAEEEPVAPAKSARRPHMLAIDLNSILIFAVIGSFGMGILLILYYRAPRARLGVAARA
ncbi:MAG: hypothetical protein ACI8W8_002743 [Rhodothermales bacterium]|jgi:hypothetical protein